MQSANIVAIESYGECGGSRCPIKGDEMKKHDVIFMAEGANHNRASGGAGSKHKVNAQFDIGTDNPRRCACKSAGREQEQERCQEPWWSGSTQISRRFDRRSGIACTRVKTGPTTHDVVQAGVSTDLMKISLWNVKGTRRMSGRPSTARRDKAGRQKVEHGDNRQDPFRLCTYDAADRPGDRSKSRLDGQER